MPSDAGVGEREGLVSVVHRGAMPGTTSMQQIPCGVLVRVQYLLVNVKR